MEKNSFCKYLSAFTDFIKYSCLNKSKFSSGFSLFKHGKKKILSEYFSPRFWDVTFMSKKNSFLWISPKMLQNNRKACGEKQFLLIFIRFDWFDQKHLLKQIQIFLRIYPFSNMVRKRNSLSISVLISEIVILCLEIKVLYEFLQKCYKK